MPQLTATLLLLTTAAASAETRVATMSFTTRGVDAQLGSVYAERFAAALRTHGITVTTEKDLASVLSVDRQKQLLGCAEASTSCLAELAGALGAPFVVTGGVSRIGSGVTLTLKVLHVEKSRTLFTLSRELESVEKVLDALEAAASEAAEKLLDAGATATDPAARTPRSTTPPWVAITLGAAGTGTGAGLLIAAQMFSGLLAGPPMMDFGPDAAMQVAQRTGPLRTAGFITLGIGAALLLAGIVWRIAVSP